jgi:GTP cyclohydrolase I
VNVIQQTFDGGYELVDPEAANVDSAARHIGDALKELGTEPFEDPHLLDTPARIARFWKQFMRGDPDFNFTTFEAEYDDQIVVQRNIPFYSLCAHHLVPFWGVAHVAYIPRKRKIAGLSKLARTVDHFAHRLQVQERLGQQVAEFLDEQLDPLGVAVVLDAEHMCMTMRGIEKPGSRTTTSVMKGAFFINPAARQELLQLIYGGGS